MTNEITVTKEMVFAISLPLSIFPIPDETPELSQADLGGHWSFSPGACFRRQTIPC